MASGNKSMKVFVQGELTRLADPEKAPVMAAYMKTSMPFYGVQKPERIAISRHLKKNFAPENRRDYEQKVEELWSLPHREEKYLALDFATEFSSLADTRTVELFERLIREGAWWDFVDVIAGHLIGALLLRYRGELSPLMDSWTDDSDLWIRRTALLSQLKHKEKTDEERLFSYCLKLAPEKEFFIRKAIGWALREYSYTAPDSVESFLLGNREALSPLSFREASKRLSKIGRNME